MGTACLSLALLVPSSALATGSHHLTMYKVEKQVTMDGDFQDVTLSCNTGDYAIDGMWRIDHVDQDNDYVGNVLQSVNVWASYGDFTNVSLWHYSFSKDEPGDAQLKVFVTCLGKKSAPNTHQHAWTISPQQYRHNFPVGVGTDATPFYADVNTGFAGAGSDPSSTLANESCAAWDTANSGTGKSILVAPGFAIVDPDGAFVRIVGSYPGSPAGQNDLKQTWSWRFESRSSGNTVHVAWRCLRLKSSTVSGHTHRMFPKLIQTSQVTPPLVPFNTVKEHKVVCGDLYKGLLAGWWLGGGGPGTGESFLWFLGMDPRPKERAFRFLNTHPSIDYPVYLSLLCFNDRTT